MKIIRNIFLLIVTVGLLSVSLAAQKVIVAKDKYAKYGDIKVHYQDQGKGKNALIFIHGWTCDVTFWKGQFAGFPDNRVIFIDLPGHGKSDKPQTAYTMEYFARAIEAVMQDAKVKKAVLVGHSMGTPVIRNFYKLYPEKTEGLVLVDGALRPFGNKEQAAQYLAMFKSNYKQTASAMIEGMISTASPQLKEEIKTSMLATPEYVAISAMEGLMDEKSYPQDKIGVPVLAILADSPFWTPDTEQYLRSVTTDLDFHMMKGVSHFLMMEKPQEFNQEVNSFITGKKLLQ
jgi:pimeloyl-ACP methyl ester carboxylesterase